jgi:hypothetical protein
MLRFSERHRWNRRGRLAIRLLHGSPRRCRLGPHEIIDPLGTGSMEEIYRARDTRLDRTGSLRHLIADWRFELSVAAPVVSAAGYVS